MFKHILVPLDGSDLAERALEPAREIASSMKAKLTLLRVVPQFALLAADPTLYEEMNRLGNDEALAYLRSVAEEIDLSDHVEVIGESGQPADIIVQYAESNEIDLIIMSSHGRSGISRWVYGSVAERVMRRASCNTAIINSRVAPINWLQTRVLIPLDGSVLAEQSLDPGKDLAKALRAEVHLLKIITPAHKILETASMQPVFDSVQEKEMEEAETYLMLKASEIENLPVKIEVGIENKSVAESILDYAGDHEIDMIVMSSHGRTGIKRWVYGSVTEKVLRTACCATLIVHS